MKYLLRSLFVLALFCAGSSLAHADSVDYRMTVLDPPAVDVCNPVGVPSGSPGNTNCTIFSGGDIILLTFLRLLAMAPELARVSLQAPTDAS